MPITLGAATITVQGVKMAANAINLSNIQIIHNPLSYTCRARVHGEPWQDGQFCDACDPPIYARPWPVRPVCMYCWKPLQKFEPLSNYKGQSSEWTHIMRLTKEQTYTKVTCKTKQYGPRVPKAIPGRLIIEEPELTLEKALRGDQY